MQPRAWAFALGRALACAFAAAAPLFACSQEQDTHPPALTECSECSSPRLRGSGSATDASSGACGSLTTSSVACGACLERQCCAAARACSDDAVCLALLGCLQSCTDTTCAASCRSTYLQGFAAYEAVTDCLGSACSTDCPTAGDAGAFDGSASCGNLAKARTSCGACVAEQCCAQDKACSSEGACPAIQLCVQNCASNDTSCLEACRAPDVSGAYGAMAACVSSACSSSCL